MRRDEQSENSALRHPLEGGLEVLEAAASRYRQLTTTLLSSGWKWRLRRASTLVAETLAQETSLTAVLARLQQRAEREPKRSGPASRLLLQFEEERTKLWRAMGQRLELNDETLSLSQGPLTERLERLGDRVLKRSGSAARHPILPGTGETLLLKGSGVLQPLVAALVLLFPWLLLPLLFLGFSDSPHPMAWGIIAALSAACWAFCHMRSGHYWLTPERLVWMPRWGLPVEVPLSSLGESTITVNNWGTVKVDALGGITLRYVPHAAELATLLCHRAVEGP